jgi:hypothetical protein
VKSLGWRLGLGPVVAIAAALAERAAVVVGGGQDGFAGEVGVVAVAVVEGVARGWKSIAGDGVGVGVVVVPRVLEVLSEV